jgi:hypothetical protein
MVRAVEILAQIAEKQLKSAHVLPPPIDVPIILFNEHIMFVIRKTQRAAVMAELGPANRVPELRARNFGEFRFVPGQIMIGSGMLRLDERFVAVAEGPDSRTYSHAFEVRFPGGVAYVQGTGGRVQRRVLYAIG